MSLLFFDGYEDYTNVDQVYEGHATNVNDSISVGAYGRFSSQGLRTPSSTIWIRKNVTPSAGLVAGAAVTCPTANWNTNPMFAFWQAATCQVSITIAADGTVNVYRGAAATLLGSSTSGAFGFASTRYFEVKAIFHTSTGSVIVKLDGNTIVSVTAANTSATTAASGDAWSNGTALGSLSDNRTWTIDDLYILNLTGSQNTDFLGDVRVMPWTATADATVTGWTPNTGTTVVSVIDETPPNDDTDYATSSATNDIAVFNMTGATLTAGTTIKGVMVRYRAKKDNAGGRALASTIKHNGTSAQGATIALASSYTTKHDIYETNPSTGNAWTPTEVAAAQPGIKTVL